MGIAIIYGRSIGSDIRHEMATANVSTPGMARQQGPRTSLSRDSGRDSFGDPADKGAKWTKFAAQPIKSVQGGIGESTHE
jgi:hypothetical protein